MILLTGEEAGTVGTSIRVFVLFFSFLIVFAGEEKKKKKKESRTRR